METKTKKKITRKYEPVPEVKLTKKEEKYLQSKFDRYAKVVQWMSMDNTYYIHVGSAIIKHTDTRDLFNLMAAAYKKDKTVKIW